MGWFKLAKWFHRVGREESRLEKERGRNTRALPDLPSNHWDGLRVEKEPDLSDPHYWDVLKRETVEARRNNAEREEAERQAERKRQEAERLKRLMREFEVTGKARPGDDDYETDGLRSLPDLRSYSGRAGERPNDDPSSSTRDAAGHWMTSGKFQLVTAEGNVYAIAYDMAAMSLYVQYKHWAPPMPLGVQAGPGPVYEYQNVSMDEARSLFVAPNPGVWIWDNLRVRGTWSRHKKPYRIVAISRGYLPRKARWNYMGDGREWFVRRQVWGATGNAVYSQLPTAPAPDMGYDGQPVRGTPYRGFPFRGRPHNSK